MSDLNTKFSTLEGQISANHTELMTALNTIAFALGAPPTTPTTSLTDVVTVLETINSNIVGMRAANALYYSSALSLLELVNTNTDTLINNNALNAQRLLIAIAANDPCKSCDIVPIEPPPIQVTPQVVNQEHCQRMQALIYALKRFTVKLDALSSFGLGFSPTVIRDAITEVTTELGVAELLQYPSLGEVGQLAGAGAAYIVSNIFSSTSLPFEFQSISDQLLTVLYDTDNASAGQSAYRSFLDGSGLDSTVIQLFKAMAYTSVFNLYYDSTNGLDVSGYDGTICEPPQLTGCWSPTAEQIVNVPVTNTISAQSTTYSACVIWPTAWSVSNTYAGTNSSGFAINIVGDANFVWNADIFGYWVSIPMGTLYGDNEQQLAGGATFQQIAVHTTYVFVLNANTGFTICESQPL